MMNKLSLVVFIFAVAVCFAPQADANDAYIGWFPDSPIDLSVDVYHEDAPDSNGDWMGWAYVGLNNSGTETWTGMSISIYDRTVGATVYDATSVKITDTPNAPFVYSPNSISSWVIGTNDSGHATINIMFSSVVAPDEDIFLRIWTDNTAQKVKYFGVAFDAIPEPATALSLALGGLLITGYRRLRKSYGFF